MNFLTNGRAPWLSLLIILAAFAVVLGASGCELLPGSLGIGSP
jgi:hypothetical protein